MLSIDEERPRPDRVTANATDCSTVPAPTLTLIYLYHLDFQSPARYGRDPYTCKSRGQRSVGSKDRVETNGRTDPTDRITITRSLNILSPARRITARDCAFRVVAARVCNVGHGMAYRLMPLVAIALQTSITTQSFLQCLTK